jgi:hypothetical protein
LGPKRHFRIAAPACRLSASPPTRIAADVKHSIFIARLRVRPPVAYVCHCGAEAGILGYQRLGRTTESGGRPRICRHLIERRFLLLLLFLFLFYFRSTATPMM